MTLGLRHQLEVRASDLEIACIAAGLATDSDGTEVAVYITTDEEVTDPARMLSIRVTRATFVLTHEVIATGERTPVGSLVALGDVVTFCAAYVRRETTVR